MKQIETSELPSGRNGPASTEIMSAKSGASGTPDEKMASPRSIGEWLDGPTASPNTPAKPMPPSVPAIVAQPLEKSDTSSSSTLLNSEIVASQSMSLLDESANHMFDLMKGLHANQPPADVKAFDPDRVNSAVACANTIYKIMRLKLDAIKVQRKLK